ncbi:carbohydrate ABC transporter permease [Cohnella phaseoli]|uniref:Raffinose/stachyose/melibiose transport system permease protein/N-acetylglucosamine transport system permease protein n=1 Tax=Cohnella phaseoli TaxID=456490 RepID=A0A3D9I901_9BACL|nr:carbohydrate ABC transporter permease [Cohnella phaseoli]RED58207.1 raffinose/stachyose/melibiose transport system permease protein/N-acetylglucosamine transport system permease protein [Cohnella phaseoli]
MQERRTFVDASWYVLLLIWSVSILFPLLWVFYESLKTNQEFFHDVWKLPTDLQWMNYGDAWTEYGIGSSMLNTVYYVGVSLIVGTFLTAINAYVLTRLEFKGKKLLWGVIMLSLFLPGINALVPQYILMRDLHLTNSLTGIVVLDSFSEIAFYLLMLSGFMQSLPKELEESGAIDGASIFQIFFKIILPLCTAGIVTVAIFKFLALYNNFLGPFIYLGDPDKYTIGVAMYQASQIMQYKADWVTLFAGLMITMIPLVLMYIFLQRNIMEGATLGAVKG